LTPAADSRIGIYLINHGKARTQLPRRAVDQRLILGIQRTTEPNHLEPVGNQPLASSKAQASGHAGGSPNRSKFIWRDPESLCRRSESAGQFLWQWPLSATMKLARFNPLDG
jgi:hypothetical protein